MSIAILPARLANQIAAGEVVERPASVVKELVENSLDAGATSIKIEIEKGGAKRIRITDNGKGIAKNELELALSRHATSKIKDLDDLESISSLGFRGEALASISSVARLTLTSKPAEQSEAWQASAEGREMSVTVKPAAHPNGTTIDVADLFFNTPARRKFLRTEKTEFSHIEEVIKRIALACFDVTFILSHNHKVIRQYRATNSNTQRSKRVAQICGQSFIEHALEVDCQHDGLHLHGWIAQPSFYRNQNDLCYSYVNSRMMRDKLINHAIRQAYADLLPSDSYPAFVLFFSLNFKDVDVNVHPAKHEVRFHQSRYVHDFIYSVCHQALNAAMQTSLTTDETLVDDSFIKPLRTMNESAQHVNRESCQYTNHSPLVDPTQLPQQQSVNDAPSGSYQRQNHLNKPYSGRNIPASASQAYSDLMTPLSVNESNAGETAIAEGSSTEYDENTASVDLTTQQAQLLHFQAPGYLLVSLKQELHLLSLAKIDVQMKLQIVQQRWYQPMVSQPLLLPVKLTMTDAVVNFIVENNEQFQHMGMFIEKLNKTTLQIRQFPALLRKKDVAASVDRLIKTLNVENIDKAYGDIDWQLAFATLMTSEQYEQKSAIELWNSAKKEFNSQFEQQLRLNSVTVDLTSSIKLIE